MRAKGSLASSPKQASQDDAVKQVLLRACPLVRNHRATHFEEYGPASYYLGHIRSNKYQSLIIHHNTI